MDNTYTLKIDNVTCAVVVTIDNKHGNHRTVYVRDDAAKKWLVLMTVPLLADKADVKMYIENYCEEIRRVYANDICY